ncbi:MAG: Amuc_1100 family pilus-like protein [Candidatus Omnitrophica bacterium]|nr:Amuc_1100 family pilus-like protein [Candidatus Omnitrophota bacterium]
MGVLLIAIIISAGVFTALLAGKAGVENKVKGELVLRENLTMAKKDAPTLEWISYLTKKNEALDKIYNGLMEKIDGPAVKMPVEVMESLKFKEKIFEVQKDLRKEAAGKQLEFKDKAVFLGFKEYETKIPRDKEVPNLTKQLEIIEELISLMFESEIETIEDIELLKFNDGAIKEKKDEFRYRVFPVRLEITSSVKNLAWFFFRLSESDFIFMPEELKIDSMPDLKDRVKGNFVISTIIFLTDN